MRVGRAALDEAAIRELEQRHPQIHFDWPRILDVHPSITPEAEQKGSKQSGRSGGPLSRDAREPAGPAQVTAAAETRAEDQNGGESPDLPPRLTAAARTFDPESLGRLRARYSEVLARLSSQRFEAGRAEELRQLAERLNPDGWVTDEDVRTGLEGFEQTLELLRRSLGPLFRASRGSDQRGRRRRRKPAAVPGAPEGEEK